MLKDFKMDLHIHSCLSPCSEPEMVPTAIVERASELNLDAIGICDHNSAENVIAVRKAGERVGVQVLGGMEICSSEEVHVLAFFGGDAALLEMQNIVYENLPGENDESYFGEQLIADENDKIVGSTRKLLIGSTTLGIEKVVELVHGLGGLAVASHVDRESFSLIGQLGFVPEDLSLDGLELSWRCGASEVGDYESYGLPLVQSSDSHFLADVGKVTTTFTLSCPSYSEVAMAFEGIEGREVSLRSKK
ncbi:MAG: PHP domain-containing protein [Planctomycetota bacterium]|jgi:PHP family Zn ribbon phosphoesterase